MWSQSTCCHFGVSFLVEDARAHARYVVVPSFQPLFQNLSQLAGERKVTFDVTDSDISSSEDPLNVTGDCVM